MLKALEGLSSRNFTYDFCLALLFIEPKLFVATKLKAIQGS